MFSPHIPTTTCRKTIHFWLIVNGFIMVVYEKNYKSSVRIFCPKHNLKCLIENRCKTSNKYCIKINLNHRDRYVDSPGASTKSFNVFFEKNIKKFGGCGGGRSSRGYTLPPEYPTPDILPQAGRWDQKRNNLSPCEQTHGCENITFPCGR